jgi:hypothetical protein
MGGACSTCGESRVVYRVLVRNPEGTRLLGRPKRRWRIILSWIFRKWSVGKWTGSSWLRDKWRTLVNRVTNIPVS